jgi:hypothetical protein
MQVCIAHPVLLMTGLDLWAVPSIFFYQTGYSTHVLRQASRRSWRIGQTKPVRVCYMAYSETAQERCLRLMGKKMQVSLALEGKLASHGLTAMDDDDDVLTALARELVTEKGIGERAAAVWKQLQRSTSCNEKLAVAPPASEYADRELTLSEIPLLLDPDQPRPRAPRVPPIAEQLTFGF